jgi:hypothetical protein
LMYSFACNLQFYQRLESRWTVHMDMDIFVVMFV